MLLLCDDAAIPWAVPQIQEQSQEWLMTTRKKGVSLGFMTHSISQVFHSKLGTLLEEGCPTRFYLPMPAALEPNIAEIYLRLGLTMNAIRTIATARPQRDVYYACTELGQRLFSLPLGPLALACLARNRAEDHALMDTILAREGREGFAIAMAMIRGGRRGPTARFFPTGNGKKPRDGRGGSGAMERGGCYSACSSLGAVRRSRCADCSRARASRRYCL